MKKLNVQIKRIYDEPENSDGVRVLVDRLWPRGISTDKAHLDHWFKEVAPSAELRKWFSHKEERFKKFKEQYIKELKSNASGELNDLIKLASSGAVTLLYGAKDEEMNQAVVLKEFIEALRKK